MQSLSYIRIHIINIIRVFSTHNKWVTFTICCCL
uniref:Uncharacterized protein n=1 Tax=Rhizophora mucronata TaxID=61149 RepID=A0A2P2JNJ7_RHIMU